MPFEGITADGRKMQVELEILRSIMEAGPIGHMLVNSKHKICAADSRAAELLGWGHPLCVFGGDKLIHDVIAFRDDFSRQEHVDMVDRWFENPIPRSLNQRGALPGLRADGSIVPLAVSLAPVVHGQCNGFCLLEDDTIEEDLYGVVYMQHFQDFGRQDVSDEMIKRIVESPYAATIRQNERTRTNSTVDIDVGRNSCSEIGAGSAQETVE